MSRTRKHPYTGSRAFDPSCRHGGSCPYCSQGRTFASKRRAPIVDDAELSPMEVTGKRYHVIKASRIWQGHPYSGPSSRGKPAHADTLEGAFAWVSKLTKRNPVGWQIVDSESGEYIGPQADDG